MKILLVDDERIKRTALRDDLVEAGYETDVAACAEEGLVHLQAERFDVVVTDLRMKAMDGIVFMSEIKRRWPDTEVIMITAYASVENAVQAMKQGAFDYITKPFESTKLILILEKIAKMHALKRENASLKAELAKATHHGEIIGTSPAMKNTFELLDIAVACDVPVLLWGETGTGKEMFATAIHRRGARKKNPFVRVSCAALSEQLMESELFGHERGSFTGAIDSKPGRFELADKGTLFLDEIDDVPMGIQVKLLRVLEGHPYERVGGVASIQADVRIIAASKVDLRKRVADSAFRSDLFYRLNVFPIWIPPLRDRREDIPLLADHFLKLYSTQETPPKMNDEALSVLWDYSWPGNVRELQNVVRRVLLRLGNRLEVGCQDLPPEIRCGNLESPQENGHPQSFKKAIESNERSLLIEALKKTGGNQSRAAASLGMKLSTFRDKLAKHGIRTLGQSPQAPDNGDTPSETK
ncbi:MAG TPA: sigma-54 dependent transcriptional regulator [Candidatus Hydrogenedentes bacterium]|nr:sigma-54 dependent transcriptional regulator [Candidatus Hydrogenedentota bacterium]HOV74937.1 sigma-54 dependent transcriptional regulator [Candidatus Hydrogenedentota bacterium]HPC16707.1 sigma-54 dependent transcriptional regulator [Candidatus Hydrogenedentota bacterium]HRT21920.1 sigma-54 dependent transcriptional regulator [Candidatus Hydrogenedentota bacterium]HRT66912.1 sigma-54 dependent transcriptional regulator [Candidatus Hydrogenedentota bacterium]